LGREWIFKASASTAASDRRSEASTGVSSVEARDRAAEHVIETMSAGQRRRRHDRGSMMPTNRLQKIEANQDTPVGWAFLLINST
jgi:hypothetical protein